jgi:Domain of unknown function (DUF4249)
VSKGGQRATQAQMRWRTIGVAAAAAMLLGGCTIAEVVEPPTEDLLVVEAVLRTDASQQFILLHRTVREESTVGESRAEVLVTTSTGERHLFIQSLEACIAVDPAYGSFLPEQVGGTCYVSAGSFGQWVQPGVTYDLTIRTVRGEIVRGRTTVPGNFTVNGIRTTNRLDSSEPVCRLPAATPLPVRWSASAGAWGYVAPLTIIGLSSVLPPSYEAPEPLELTGLAVSARDTTLTLPTQFGVFDRFQYNQDLLRVLQQGLPEGTSARVVIAAADRNYINGVRGGTFNPSGRVRISSIVGDGVGVFGSLNALGFAVEVGAPTQLQPSCFGA